MRNTRSPLYDALRSKILGLALLIALAILVVIGIFIPQNMSLSFYAERYSTSAAKAMTTLGLHGIYSSLVFFAFAGVASMYLVLGAYHSAVHKKWGRFIACSASFVLLLGFVLILQVPDETIVYARKGESFSLADGSLVFVADIHETRYKNGRLKSWETTVKIIDDPSVLAGMAIDTPGDFDTLGETGYADPRISSPGLAQPAPQNPIPSFSWQEMKGVEHRIGQTLPTRINGFALRQKDLKSSRYVILKDSMGIERSLRSGEKIAILGGSILLMDLGEAGLPQGFFPGGDATAARFLVESGDSRTLAEGSIGSIVGPMVFSRIVSESSTGIAIAAKKGASPFTR
jgi:hypothetical protein